MVSKHGILFSGSLSELHEIQILMNVGKILMAVITSVLTPLGHILVAVVQVSDLHQIDSFAMVHKKIVEC